MAEDERMHSNKTGEGSTPGMVPGRGHERHEEPVRLNHPEPGEDQPGTGGHGNRLDDTSDMGELHRPGALGGHTATRTANRETPADER